MINDSHLDHGILEVVDVVLDGGGRAADVPALRLAAGSGGLPGLGDLVPGLGIWNENRDAEGERSGGWSACGVHCRHSLAAQEDLLLRNCRFILGGDYRRIINNPMKIITQSHHQQGIAATLLHF